MTILPDHMNMSTGTERDVVACQSGHFGQTEPCLHGHQEEGVIAPAEPSTEIGRCEQRLDFRTREKMNLGPREALAGHGQHTLNLGGVGRRFERSILKEGVDGG